MSFVSEAHSSPSPTAGATLTGRTFHSIFQSCRLALRRSHRSTRGRWLHPRRQPRWLGAPRIRHRLQIDPGAAEPGLLDYLLLSGSNRIGGLDFQTSPTEYVHRGTTGVTLDDLMRAADAVEAGEELAPELRDALLLESSPGGAYPKALIEDGERHLLAKFSSRTEDRPVLKYEYAAMTLARRCGLDVAPVGLVRVPIVTCSSLSASIGMPEADGLSCRPSPCLGLGRLRAGTRATPTSPSRSGVVHRAEGDIERALRSDHVQHPRLQHRRPREEPRRLLGWVDVDAHAGVRRHSATARRGEATQAMAIGEDGWKMSQVAGCVERASTYLLDRAEAREIVDRQVAVVEDGWDEVAATSGMSAVERREARGRQFLNPYALEGM